MQELNTYNLTRGSLKRQIDKNSTNLQTSSNTKSNKDNNDAGNPEAVFVITAAIGLLKLRSVWIRYLQKIDLNDTF